MHDGFWMLFYWDSPAHIPYVLYVLSSSGSAGTEKKEVVRETPQVH